MALRSIRLIYCLGNYNYILRSAKLKSTIVPFKPILNVISKEFKTEDNLNYLEDPDNFGSLSRKLFLKDIPEDEGDMKEERYQNNVPLPSQKLTIKQYADIIKQYLQYKRIKEAIDVLEVRMLQQDKVKPENYIYNILIGACAEVGYTKKAFSLFNDMKRRGLKPTGDTYTCLFTACCNSPWPENGLKHAHHLKQLMLEKGVEPNLTNYHCMIKAFGKCGDLLTAFKIVDEMKEKKIKIRVHTFNHLLHACISDKANGLRHAIILWRKMLSMREKPNVYSFNLMLKCVKDCNLGSLEDIRDMVQLINSSIPINAPKSQMIESAPLQIAGVEEPSILLNSQNEKPLVNLNHDKIDENAQENEIKMEFIGNRDKAIQEIEPRTTPNLLSKVPCMRDVLSLQPVHTPHGKFAIVGGQEDFLREMEHYSATPDIKTFTQMLAVIGNSTEEELCLIESMKKCNIKTDISFYNMLIKKRCLRGDYEAALEVQKMIKEESEFRKKRYTMNKKLRLNPNVMTYGVLAMACRKLDKAEQLLKQMEEKKLKLNGEILGTLLRQGTYGFQFKYVKFILNKVIEENININDVFLKHLEEFNERCTDVLQNKDEADLPEFFESSYNNYLKVYERFLTQINIDEVLTPEHPWQQFKEPQPETLQKSNIIIKQPKRFFKKNRKFVKPYTARI